MARTESFTDLISVLNHDDIISSTDFDFYNTMLPINVSSGEESDLTNIIKSMSRESLIYEHFQDFPTMQENFQDSEIIPRFPTGYFKIRNRSNGRCLDINQGSSSSNAQILVWECHDGLNQQWYADSSGRIKSRLSNYFLGLNANNSLVTQESQTTSNQKWSVDQIGKIKNQGKNLYLSFSNNNYYAQAESTTNQRWYFETVAQPNQITRLLNSFDGRTEKSMTIPNSKILPSNNYTYYVWIKITDANYKINEFKHIFHKGPVESNPRSPGLWIHPGALKLHLTQSTTIDWNETCNPDYVLPTNEWVHIAYVLRDQMILAYVNAQLIQQCPLRGLPNNNNFPISIGLNGFGGQIRNLEHANYAMTRDNLGERMNLTQPETKCHDLAKLPLTLVPTNLITNFDWTEWSKSDSTAETSLNQICPPRGLGGTTVSLVLKSGFPATYSNHRTLKLEQTAYRFSLWVKNDNTEPIQIRVNPSTSYQTVAKQSPWIQLNWIFRPSTNFVLSLNLTGINPNNSVHLFLPILTLASQPIPVPQNVLKNVKYSSDDSYPIGPETNPDCAPENAELNHSSGWCSAQLKALTNYLQIDFPGVHHITHIITQGRSNADQWVTRYLIQYLNENNEWIRDTELTGNADRNTYKINELTLTTKSIRIYPVAWNQHASLRIGFLGQINPIQMQLKVTQYSSNGSYETDCPANMAVLNSNSAWCAIEPVGNKYYIQADFDQIYRVDHILTQGRNNGAQWTTEYRIEYEIPYTSQWQKFGSTFTGNSDQNTIKTNQLGLTTQKIRIYPLKWSNWPSLRIGFEGVVQKLDKCSEYLNKSKYAKTNSERSTYQKLFNQECRKVEYTTYTKELESQKNSYQNLKKQYEELKVSSENKSKNMNKMEIDLMNLRKQLSTAVQATSPEEVSCQQRQLRSQVLKLRQQLSLCQREFVGPLPKLTENFETSTVLKENFEDFPASQENFETSSITNQSCIKKTQNLRHYDIRNHRDYPALMSQVIPKNNCLIPKQGSISLHPDFKYYIAKDKVKDIIQSMPIEVHPGYQALMNKYALKTEAPTCPPTYQPCPKQNIVCPKPIPCPVTQCPVPTIDQCAKHFINTV